MKIFIRADGGKDIGLGHVMRMLVLGTELKKNNEVIFICKNCLTGKYESGIKKIKEYEFEVIRISETKYISEIIELQNKCSADLLITDSYDVDEEYFIKMKKYFKITGYVDDINKCKMDVNFIINQNINAFDLDYSKTVNINTKLFLGTKYCMLRDEFRKVSRNKFVNEDVNNILLTLGGMDNNYNTITILEKIKNSNKDIYVVIGNVFPKELTEKIYSLSKYHNNIHICEDANMSELMLKCDIAISACGSTLYELSAMRVPTIGIIVAENQKCVAEKMSSMELIFDCFNIENIEKINLSELVSKLIEDKILRKRIIEKQKKIVDLHGVEKLSNEINEILNRL